MKKSDCNWLRIMKKSNFDFRIKISNTDESKKVQKILFGLGCRWNSSGKKIVHTTALYFFIDTKRLVITYYGDKQDIRKEGKIIVEEYFKSSPCKEITFDRLNSEGFGEELKKVQLLRSLENGDE